MDRGESLKRLAATQYDLITVPQLHALGFSNQEVTKLCRSGDLTRIRRGLLALRDLDGTYEQLVMAACLYPNVKACASGLTAARIWGLWGIPEQIEVSVRYPRKVSAPGVRVHRSADLLRHDVTHVDYLPVTTPTRTLVDLGRVLPPVEVGRLLDHAIATGLVDVGRVEQLRIRVSEHGRNGAGVIRLLLEQLPELAALNESGPEVDVMRLIEEGRLPAPEPQWWVTVDGNRYRIDHAYPDIRLALEYDGFDTHHTEKQLARDSERQLALESIGWEILRIRAEDLRGEARYALKARIREALNRRSQLTRS